MRTTRYFLKQSITIRAIPCVHARSQSCVSGHSLHSLNRPMPLHCISRSVIPKLTAALSSRVPAYTELGCELEQYQKTFEPPYSSRPASGFLLVSFSKVTRPSTSRPRLSLFAESLPKKANDYRGVIGRQFRNVLNTTKWGTPQRTFILMRFSKP